MHIDEQIKAAEEEFKKSIGEADEGEAEAEQVEDEEAVEDEEGGAADDGATEGDDSSDDAPPAKPEQKPDNSAELSYRLREEKRRNDELSARLDALEKPKEEPKQDAPQRPDPNEDPLGAMQYDNKVLQDKLNAFESKMTEREKAEHAQNQRNQAIQELGGYIQNFKAKATDFDAVANHMEGELAKAVKALYPAATQDQVQNVVNEQILKMASQAAQAGYDPAAYLYEVSKQHYGYKPASEEKPVLKPDLKTVEKNMRKSANGVGGGKGGATFDLEAISKMSPAELQRNNITDAMISEMMKQSA